MRLIILILIVSVVSVSYGQTTFWGKTTESAYTNEAMGIVTDNSGNSYIAGYITGETAFGTNLAFANAPGNGDIYVAKYSPNGDLAWVKKFGGPYSDRAYAIAIDNSGGIIVVGQYSGTADFDGTTITSVSNSRDIFILKMDLNGNVVWVKSEGGGGTENVYGVTTDIHNNIIITGQFQGNTLIGGQAYSSMLDPSNNQHSYDLFISKYDSSGNPIWVNFGSAKYEERGLDVATDVSGNVYLSAQFSDTLTIAGQTLNNNGYNVALLMKFNANGSIVWTNTLNSTMVIPYGIEVKGNHLYVAGDCGKNLKYSNNNNAITESSEYPKSVFVLKTDLNGGYSWMSRVGSHNPFSASALTINSSDEVYVTGYFSCSLSELHETETAYYNSVGYKDTYLWKVNSNGSFEYLKNFGGKRDDYGRGIALSNNRVTICGSFVHNMHMPIDNDQNYLISNENNEHFNLKSSGVNEYLYLKGDVSANSFITTAMNDYSKKYNYFNGQPTDSLYMYIQPMLDTNIVCQNSNASAFTNTNSIIGPIYNVLWNTNDSTFHIPIEWTGMYSCIIEREDGCSGTGMDSTYFIVNLLPPLPVMYDSLGLAVAAICAQDTGYYNYHFCYPDSVNLWFENLAQNCTISITNPSQGYSDTLPHFYNYTGTTTVYVTDTTTGCSNSCLFTIKHDEVYSDEEYDPYLTFIDVGDSIEICEDEQIKIENHNYFNNPNGTPGLLPDVHYVTVKWTTYLGNSIVDTKTYSFNTIQGNWKQAYKYAFTPPSSGEYIVKCYVLKGYDNLCGIETTPFNVQDTIYVVVNPNPVPPVFTILSDDLLCPDGSVYLYVTNPHPAYSWSGPGIQWYSPYGDSIQATTQGLYKYSGEIVDLTTYCSASSVATYYLNEKQPPTIESTSSDGIICPYDSLYMYVSQDYQSYEWHGPQGAGIGYDYFQWGDIMGYYYVTVVDEDGCELTSLPYEIKEYMTPYLSVEPYNTICMGETATIDANVFGDGTINWINPSNSSAPSITVDEPGWYVCEMTHCGITVVDSVEIIDMSIDVTITASDTIVCFGEPVEISVDSGPGYYEWSNGEEGVSTIYVSEAGNYWVSVENEYGCTDISDTITLEYIEGSAPPEIADTSTCDAGLITISAGEDVLWYTNDSTYIETAHSITIDLQSDTTILVSYPSTEVCPLAYSSVFIELIPHPIAGEIYGDTALCVGEDLVLYTDDNEMNFIWYHNNDTIFGMENMDSITIPYDNLADNDTIMLEIYNECGNVYSYRIIQLLPQHESVITEDSLFVCKNTDVIIETEQTYSSTTWLDGSNIVEGDVLIFNSDYPHYVYVIQEDENGCYTLPDSVWVSMPNITIHIGASAIVSCVGDTVTLFVPSGFESITWETPQGVGAGDTLTIELTELNEGWYIVEAYDSVGCFHTDSIELFANINPEDYTMPIDTIICLNEYIGLLDNFGDYEVLWNGESIDSVQINDESWYVVTVTDPSSGCSVEDSIYIQTVNCTNELPNVITPNNDGVNDYFVIEEALILPNNYFIVFNRWGNVVYEEHTYENTFNAEGLSDGVYFFRFYRDYKNNPKQSIEGFFHVLR